MEAKDLLQSESLATTNTDQQMYWIIDHDELFWAPGKLIQDVGKEMHVQCIIDNEYYSIDKPAVAVHPSCLTGVENLLDLGEFNEGSLLHTIRTRFQRQEIFTSIGSPILISVNPFQKLPNVFTSKTAALYRLQSLDLAKGIISKKNGGSGKESPGPHLFRVAEDSYQNMMIEKKNQSIIISGESGAGKTEATKIILCYLAQANTNFQSDKNIDFIDMQRQSNDPSNKSHQSVERQVLDSNPLLEAFGNAKTFKNNNSSRFGKFIKVHFESNTGKITSAGITQYLLEKSRVVMQLDHERNFHIFYQVLSSEALRQKYKLKSVKNYNYVNQSSVTTINGVSDSDEMTLTQQCMRNIGFSNDQINQIMDMIVALLNLGNIQFFTQHKKGAGSCAHLSDESGEFVTAVTILLGLKDEKEVENLLCTKVNIIMNERMVIDLQAKDAVITRDSIAKLIYKKLFTWLVKRVNQSINIEDASQLKSQSKKNNQKFIGILDIFGFEIFEQNSFEQLMINYANEKLQHQFNTHMFAFEQEEYKKEKIKWESIQFIDNLGCINLIESQSSSSLFKVLDEECMINGNGDSLLRKMNDQLSNNKSYSRPKNFRQDANKFIIKHYAGDVEYTSSTFVEKNKDTVNEQISDILSKSKNELLGYLFSPENDEEKKQQEAQQQQSKPQNIMSQFNQQSKFRNSNSGPAQSLRGNTLSNQFRLQLKDLISTLQESSPSYIRCIKPNSKFSPTDFDSYDVCKQLRSAGMLEAIRIRKQGFAIRINMEEFIGRYKSIFGPKANRELPDELTLKLKCEKIFQSATQQYVSFTQQPKSSNSKKESPLTQGACWQVGLTKIFMKEGARHAMEAVLAQSVKHQVVFIQKIARGASVRVLFKIMKVAQMRRKRILTGLVRGKKTTKAGRVIQKFIRRRALQMRVLETINNRIKEKKKLYEAEITPPQKRRKTQFQQSSFLEIPDDSRRANNDRRISFIAESISNIEATPFRDVSVMDESNYDQITGFLDQKFSPQVPREKNQTIIDVEQIKELPLDDLREKYISILQENEGLKSIIATKDRQLMNKRVSICSILKSIETATGTTDSQNSVEALSKSQQEVSKLSCQIEILLAQIETQEQSIASQKEEISQLFQLKEKWIKKLDEEIERNASIVGELNSQLQDLKDTNFKQEFSLNQRQTINEPSERKSTKLVEEFNSTKALLSIDLRVDENQDGLSTGDFDPSSIEDLHQIMRQMQKHLKAKSKAHDQLEEENFLLESTVKRDNERLKIQSQKYLKQIEEGEEAFGKYKSEAQSLQQEITLFQQDQNNIKSIEFIQTEDKFNKLQAKNTILQNETTHLKQQNHEISSKFKFVQNQNEMYIDQVQQYKKLSTELQVKSNLNSNHSKQDFLISELKQSYHELKNKYNKVKEKCFKLNKENDFYNQAITVFLTIKKVLEKKNKFTTILYKITKHMMQTRTNSIQYTKNGEMVDMAHLVGASENRTLSHNSSTAQGQSLSVNQQQAKLLGEPASNKRNLFTKQSSQDKPAKQEEVSKQAHLDRNSFSLEGSSESIDLEQNPEDLIQGIYVCRDKLAQLDQKLKKLLQQLKSNQMDLLVSRKGAGEEESKRTTDQKILQVLTSVEETHKQLQLDLGGPPRMSSPTPRGQQQQADASMYYTDRSNKMDF